MYEFLTRILAGVLIVIYGWKLLKIYEDLKANARDHLQESEGPHDPDSGEPYIQKIEHRMEL